MLSSAFLLLVAGCSSSEEDTFQKDDFKSKSHVEETIDFEKIIENYYGDRFRFGTKTSLREYGFTLTEIVIKEEVVGYTLEDGVSLKIGDIRFIESDKKLNLLDISTDKLYVFDMVYNDEYGFDVPIFDDDNTYEAQWGSGLSMSLCSAACTLGTNRYRCCRWTFTADGCCSCCVLCCLWCRLCR